MTNGTALTYQVYVAPIIAMAGKDIPPGQSRSTWSPISATLISGRQDAVLVDPLMTVEQGMAVADWVSTTGKNLTTVYITHGHGDHWFGLDLYGGFSGALCRLSTWPGWSMKSSSA
jgi:glyoxylase-like metal-dependent hydrolase (beta-lactamase superfamily II)